MVYRLEIDRGLFFLVPESINSSRQRDQNKKQQQTNVMYYVMIDARIADNTIRRRRVNKTTSVDSFTRLDFG